MSFCAPSAASPAKTRAPLLNVESDSRMSVRLFGGSRRILELGRVRHLLILVPPVPAKPNWQMPLSGSIEERWKNVLFALNSTRWMPVLAGQQRSASEFLS